MLAFEDKSLQIRSDYVEVIQLESRNIVKDFKVRKGRCS